MLDSSEGVCPGQARFEYPATSVLFSMCSHRVQLCALILLSRHMMTTESCYEYNVTRNS